VVMWHPLSAWTGWDHEQYLPKERGVMRREGMGNMERPKRYNAIPRIRYLQHIYAETRERTVLDSGEMYCMSAGVYQLS
jgi:hypothetical protein